jgi:predicted permease
MSAGSDVRFALRLFARSPIFTLTSIGSLTVGIAASTAIFSLADALLLRPRPGVANPSTLVDIGRTTNGEGFDNFGYPLFQLMRERSTSFAALSMHVMTPYVMSLGDAHSSERVYAGLVSGNYFEVVGTRPAAGRFFVPDEDRTSGTHPVVVLSHQFWTRRFGGDPAIVGQTIRLNNLPYTIVGVAEPGFTGTTVFGADFWAPMGMDAHVRAAESSLRDRHGSVFMTAIGRLAPGVSTRQARGELSSIMRAYLTERGDDRRERWGVAVSTSTRVPQAIAGSVVGFVAMLGALTTIVLLIACSNVAGMLLARALGRRREVATRLAVGATRGRVLRQLLIEGLTLALLAGALSIPVTVVLVALLASYQPGLPLPIAIDLRIDPRAIGIAFALSTLSAVAFALLPGLRTTSFDLAPALHGAHSTMERRRSWLRHSLVAAQVAMALLLLVAAGLFLRSLQRAASIDAGFDPRDVDTLQIDTRIAGYRTDAEGVQAVLSLVDRFRTLPGVTAVGASRMVPLQGGGLGLGGLRAPGYQGPDGSDAVRADWDVVSPDYFRTLGLDIRQGRAFELADREGAPYVVIVNETLAERVWPGKNPVGMQLLQATGDTTRTLHVVGVAKRGKYRSINEAPRNFIYVPLAQQFLSDMTFYVRHEPGASRANDLRRTVASFNPMLPVIHTQPLEEASAIGLLPQRLAAWVAGSVGTIGLLLAAFGLYGMTSFAVAQRTREIAIRMALGASGRGVLWMILRQAATFGAIGGAAGLLLAAVASVLLESLLIGLAPIDPVAFSAAGLLLSCVLLAASIAPARRAARMDPMRALRSE